MPDLFQYIDYRSYLRAVFQERKALGRYSYSQFATELGFQERTFVQHMLAGKRDLSEQSLPRVLEGLGLHTEERHYFRLLHTFATEKDAKAKQNLWEQIRQQVHEFQNETPAASQRLELMGQWHSFAIKELLCMGVTEALDIRRALCQPLSLEQIRESIAELIRLEFVQMDEMGTFVDLEPEISAPTQTEQAAIIHQFQAQMQEMAFQALEYAQAKDREYQTLSLSLSPSAFFEVKQALRQCRDQIIQIYNNDSNPKNGVYQVNLNTFPLALKKDH